MKQFKKIMAQSHTQNRDCLHGLYTDRQIYLSCLSSSMQPIEDEKVYFYRNISFTFAGTGYRTPQRMILYVWVPKELLGYEGETAKSPVPCEDWLLRNLSGPVNALACTLRNDHKDAREKPDFSMQETGAAVRRRSGCLFIRERQQFRLQISYTFPLIGGHSVNGKSGYKGVKMLLEDYRVYDKTMEIRDMLLCAGSEDGGEYGDGQRLCRWTERRVLPHELRLGERYAGYTVQFDHERCIRLGEITADLKYLTVLDSPGQLHTLAWLLEMLLLQERSQDGDLRFCCERLVQDMFEDFRDVALTSRTHGYELQLEEVRGLDLLMAAFRLRNP